MADQRKSPFEFLVEELDRELIAGAHGMIKSYFSCPQIPNFCFLAKTL